MSNKLKETDNKMVYYFIDDKINIKNLDPNKRKIDEIRNRSNSIRRIYL